MSATVPCLNPEVCGCHTHNADSDAYRLCLLRNNKRDMQAQVANPVITPSVKPKQDTDTKEFWVNPQIGIFSHCYTNLDYDDIPIIVGAKLKGNDGGEYEVVAVIEGGWDPSFIEPMPIILSLDTGEEVDDSTDILFDVQKLPVGDITNQYMKCVELENKHLNTQREVLEEKNRLGIIDYNFVNEEDTVFDDIDPMTDEIRLVDKDGYMHSTDAGVPDEYNKFVFKVRRSYQLHQECGFAQEDLWEKVKTQIV